MVEQYPLKVLVGGSSPSGLTSLVYSFSSPIRVAKDFSVLLLPTYCNYLISSHSVLCYNQYMSEGGESPRVTKVTVKDSKVISVSKAPPATREKILTHSEKLKQRAMELFPNHEGGEEVARIDAFFEREGLKTKPVKILTPKELEVYIEELGKVGLNKTNINRLRHGPRAVYINDLGLIVAVKRPEYEEGTGAVHFQAVIAHEKAHSTSEYEDLVYTQTEKGISFGPARIGQVLTQEDQGDFFEEGFAEYMAARFVRTELNLPNGIWQNSDLRRVTEEEPFLPPVYFWSNASYPGGMSRAKGAFAGYGLELIAQREPRLHTALIEARKSKKGLQEVAQIIDSLRPGLYTELRKLSGSSGGFQKGLQTIQAVIG